MSSILLQVSLPLAGERPASLHLPAHPPQYAATLRPQSLCQGGRGVSPLLPSPRYNSLPNLQGLVYEQSGTGSWGYQSHPRDEEKRLAYTRGQHRYCSHLTPQNPVRPEAVTGS